MAREAKVSTATVSRVMNDTGEVSAELSERVLAVAQRLRYHPSSAARALRRGATQMCMVIVPDIENPFFTSVVRGIEQGGRSEGYRILLCDSDDRRELEDEYIAIAAAERIGGVFIAATSNEPNLAPLLEREIPVVAVDRRPKHGEVSCVVVDNKAGAKAATAHLIQAGARRIGCITGPRQATTANERLAGYRAALSEAGTPFDQELIRREDFRPQGGFDATLSLWATDPPDALFVANNLMTTGALHALRELGCSIPSDVRVVGWDDSPWAELLDPPLTVVAQPNIEIGRSAARLLAALRKGGRPQTLLLSPELIVRDSTSSKRVTRRNPARAAGHNGARSDAKSVKSRAGGRR